MELRTVKHTLWTAALALGLAVSGWQPGPVSAQEDGLEVVQVRKNFYMIAGAGGNIGVQIGSDGIVLVNAGTASNTDRVLAALKTLTPLPIRYIINTDAGAEFVGGNEKCYQGMIIGENSRGDDLDVNPMKAKQLTNVRASGKDEAVRLTPPRRLTLEQAIAYIEEDELVEVTPKSIRLRKQVLNPSFRKKRVKEE